MKWFRFDGMVWPWDYLDDASDSIEWKLRYGTPTKNDLLCAASIMSAYAALVLKTNKDRNKICKTIKERLK